MIATLWLLVALLFGLWGLIFVFDEDYGATGGPP
jgi:hypothetical protein